MPMFQHHARSLALIVLFETTSEPPGMIMNSCVSPQPAAVAVTVELVPTVMRSCPPAAAENPVESLVQSKTPFIYFLFVPRETCAPEAPPAKSIVGPVMP